MDTLRCTRILATLGPACADEKTLVAMVMAGLNAVRVNTSYADLDSASELFSLARRVEEKTGRLLAVIFDLQGPKIRLDDVPDGEIEVFEGQNVVIAVSPLNQTSDSAGEGGIQPSSEQVLLMTKYAGLPDELDIGDELLIGDGEVILRVEETGKESVTCRVLDSGVIKRKKGITRPGKSFAADALQPRDFEFIRLGCELGVDFFAVSFVRCGRDMEIARAAIAECGSDIPLISKIEQPEAVECLDEVLEASDAVMVARGDLGLFLPLERVPIIQKRIISRCKDYALPVITATQMLESMCENEYPTRAEVSDVANAILDGTDAVMLSGETATGKYPLHVIDMITRIAAATEPTLKMPFRSGADFLDDADPIASRIANGACRIAVDLRARAIIAPTMSGYSARNVARFRPSCAIIAPTFSVGVARRLALSFGVLPVVTEKLLDTEHPLYEQVQDIAGFPEFESGDVLVFIGGIPSRVTGITNFIKVEAVSKETA